MQNVFYSLRELDKRAEENFNLKNGILMENAARGSAEKIKNLFPLRNGEAKRTLQIVCGSGDNGGDGLALARILYDYFNVIVVCIKEPKSELCRLQKDRLDKLKIPIHKTIVPQCDIIFDAFLGTGLKGKLKDEDKKLIEKINEIRAFKIACDIPSGLNAEGQASPATVISNITFSMGALKTAFFSDEAKDITGKIEVIDLGLPRSLYEKETECFLLEKKDLVLPVRKKQNAHKKSFGHTAVIAGEKKGAAFLAASAALKFGAGLVTICSENEIPMPADFMYSKEFAKEFTSAVVGSGLGKRSSYALAIITDKDNENFPFVLDADIFYYEELKTILPKLKKAVLTPHPKEFSSLLNICGLGKYSVEEIQSNRFEFVKMFCKKYPDMVLILKGANVLIGQNKNIFINSFGTSALSKAGSGDVLTGLTASLLAQNYQPLEAAISASLAHTSAAAFIKSSYSLTASSLIDNLDKLENRFT